MLAGEEIGEARVVPYRWLAYGGWGRRYGRQGGRMSRAYSAPFVGRASWWTRRVGDATT